jgi:hypothetical protein
LFLLKRVKEYSGGEEEAGEGEEGDREDVRGDVRKKDHRELLRNSR